MNAFLVQKLVTSIVLGVAHPKKEGLFGNSSGAKAGKGHAQVAKTPMVG